MSEPLASFEVIGDPKAQGSKRAFVVGGKARMTEMAGAAGNAWRDSVARAGRDVAEQLVAEGLWAPLDGALGLTVEFRFAMPKSRPARVRALGESPKTTAPDLSKLVRSLEDGLQAGGLITDDARLCRIVATKTEVVGWTGAIVTITREDPTP